MSASELLRALTGEVAALEGLCESSRRLLGGRSAPTREEHEKLCALNGEWIICANGRIVHPSSWDTWESIEMFALQHPDARWWAIAPGVGVFDPRPEPRLSEKGRATLDRLRPRRTKGEGQ